MYTSGPTTPVAEAGTGRALPVIAITVLLFGLSFGLLSREAGITPLTATVMSLLVAAGSTQIGALTALAAGAPTSAAILAGLTLSLRYIPLGVVVGAALPRTWWRRLIDVHLLTDQGIMLGRRLDGTIDVRLYRLAGLVVLVTWVSGTAAGAWGAPALTDPSLYGVDAAYPALFLALLGPLLRADSRARAAAGTGFALALLSHPFLPVGLSVLVATVGVLAAWRPLPESPRAS